MSGDRSEGRAQVVIAGAVAKRAEKISVPGASIEEVLCPETVAQVEEVVREAGEARSPLLIVGGRTRLELANPARGVERALTLEAITGVLEFEPDEGVVHAAAGMKLAALREIVAREGWELPLDSPGPNTTVGGTIASAVLGPRAQAFGSVSDAILGLSVVGGDGVASKCGGRVVKNVTGYDMAKLYCGSFGSLAVVTSAWLRLRPVAERVLTLRIEVETDSTTFERVRGFAALDSVRALVWSETDAGGEVLVELGGAAAGVDHDRARIEGIFSTREVAADRIDGLRDARTTEAIAPDQVALRARVQGSGADGMRRVLREVGLAVSADPGLGVLHAIGSVGDVGVLQGIRTRAEQAGGFATFEALPGEWRSEIDVFGSLGGTEPLVSALAQRFDPVGILNPGRFAGAARPSPDAGEGIRP